MSSIDYKKFVLVEIIILDVFLDIRYFYNYNFVGERIDGYEESLTILTIQAALALK